MTLRSLALALLLVPGCAFGSMQRAYSVAPTTVAEEVTVARAQRAYGGGGAPSFWFEADSDSDSAVRSLETGEATGSTSGLASGTAASGGDSEDARGRTRELYAQAQTSVTPPEAEATDAVDTSGELLIYTALFHVGVYDVEAGQAAIAESARAMGGFVFAQSDDSIVVRVPAARFASFMGQIDDGYDVLHREVQAQDVGDEFRDVEVRIRNLQAERDGIAALLERGLSVEQVLVVERELERVTSELEQMRARQRFLSDRISLSTITVMFRPQPHDTIDQPEVFQLPFTWLESLGLPNLLELR